MNTPSSPDVTEGQDDEIPIQKIINWWPRMMQIPPKDWKPFWAYNGGVSVYKVYYIGCGCYSRQFTHWTRDMVTP